MTPSPASKGPYQSGLPYPPGQSASHGRASLFPKRLPVLGHQVVTPFRSNQRVPLLGQLMPRGDCSFFTRRNVSAVEDRRTAAAKHSTHLIASENEFMLTHKGFWRPGHLLGQDTRPSSKQSHLSARTVRIMRLYR